MTFSSVVGRPNVSMEEFEKRFSPVEERNSAPFLGKTPDTLLSSCANPSQKANKFSWDAAHFGNSTSITGLLERADAEFFPMFQRKAFLHWFTQEGMVEEEVRENPSHVSDFVQHSTT